LVLAVVENVKHARIVGTASTDCNGASVSIVTSLTLEVHTVKAFVAGLVVVARTGTAASTDRTDVHAFERIKDTILVWRVQTVAREKVNVVETRTRLTASATRADRCSKVVSTQLIREVVTSLRVAECKSLIIQTLFACAASTARTHILSVNDVTGLAFVKVAKAAA
jgi:hypothetical protein